MGDVSIIARRLSDKYVQYGWSGNGVSFRSVGAKLLTWYDTPEMVEYLFGLGQLRQLGEPYSEEHTSDIFRTERNGTPHWVGSSEQQIFSKIAFVDYGYFYDADQIWYYVTTGPFRLKLPLTLIGVNLDSRSFEFSFLRQVESLVLEEIFNERHAERLERGGHGRVEFQKIWEDLIKEDYPLYQLCDRHRSIFDCFDDWVLIRPDESGTNIGEIILRPKEEPHMETIYWK